MTASKQRWLWALSLIPLFWAMAYRRMMGSDLWWHIAAGDWMREHGQVVRTDPFSYTMNGKEWIHHEWLSDVLFSFWKDTFGIETLVYWKFALVIATYVLLFRAVVQLNGQPFGSAIAVVLGAATAAPFLDLRPQLYTFLGLAVLFNLFWAEGKARWFIPPLIVLWVNLHGGFMFAMMSLFILLLPEMIWETEKRKSGAILFLVSGFATFLNPHGVKTALFPFKYVLKPDNPYLTMAEWLSPLKEGTLKSPVFWWLVAMFLLSALSLALSKARPRDKRVLAAFLLACLALAMALKSRRFIPIFGICQAAILAQALEPFGGRTKAPVWLGPVITFVIGCFCLAPYPKNVKAFPYLALTEAFPVDTVDAMEANGISGKFFAYYNWGGYLHMRGQGRWKVFIDGRADTVYEAKHILAYYAVLGRSPDWTQLLDISGAEYFLWRNNDAKLIQDVMATGKWKPLYSDQVSVLLGRSSVRFEPLKPPPDSPTHQETLGRQAAYQQDWKRAEMHYQKAVAAEPSVRRYYILEGLQKQDGRDADAARSRELRLRCFPEDTLFQRLVGL